MRQSVQGLFRILEEWWQRQLSLGIPAQHLTNQLPSSALPPATGTGKGGVVLSDATPNATGTAAAGTATPVSRGDHVHALSEHNHQGSAGDGGKITNEAHDGYSVYEEIAAPSSPAANTARLYARDKSGVTELFYKNDAGTERDLSSVGGGGSALTIEEVDGSPTESAPTKLIFPNGTLAVSSHEVTYTPTGGGGGNVISTGAFGSEPGSPASGDLYLPNTGFVVERYSGSAWVPWGPIFPITDPTIGAPTSWVNQGGASVATAGGGITLTDPASGGTSASGKLRKKAAPTAPYTITALFLPTFVAADYMSGGLCFRQSSDGKLIYFKIQYNSSSAATFLLAVVSASSPTAEVANLRSVPLGGSAAHLWLQIADDATNRVYRYSLDGQNFIDIYSEGRTTYLTADEVGWYIDSRNATYAAALTLLSWKET